MIRDTLARVAADFDSARKDTFAGHPLADWLRKTVPTVLEGDLAGLSEFRVVASPGKGNWGHGPWIGFFDPMVTDTAQHGHYVVYLFSSDLARVYISLNQGVTGLIEELKRPGARVALASRAALMRARLGEEFKTRFNDAPIDLEHPGAGSLLEFYEFGHAFGRQYDTSNLPTEEELVGDLREMLRLYKEVTFLGGAEQLDDDLEGSLVNGEPATIEEIRRYSLHRRVERRRKLARDAKKIHGTICQVCRFDFATHFDELGAGYIEAHHKVPIHTMKAGGSRHLSPKDDFAVVCGNCHRMLHRRGAPESFEDFVAAYGR